jgi:hypothetical protein
MKKFIIPLVLLPVGALAATGVANLSWTNPTTYTNGNPLAATDISATEVYCDFTPTGGVSAACGGTPTEFAGSGATGSYTFSYPSVGGVACFYVRTRVGTGPSSDPSSPKACKNFAALKPGQPSGLTVTVTVAVTP